MLTGSTIKQRQLRLADCVLCPGCVTVSVHAERAALPHPRHHTLSNPAAVKPMSLSASSVHLLMLVMLVETMWKDLQTMVGTLCKYNKHFYVFEIVYPALV